MWLAIVAVSLFIYYECLEHVMHENDNIVMIFKVVGNHITNNYFSISKKRDRSLVFMLTFSRDCFNSRNSFDIIYQSRIQAYTKFR